MKAFLTWVSSLEVPGWSPISLSGCCWLQFLHPLCWVFSFHTQQFSTVQSTYAEHGSQVLLDVLVVEHGLQGSLWKIHFKLSLTGESWIKCQLRTIHAKICPANYMLEHILCRITFDLSLFIPGPSIVTSYSLQQWQLNTISCIFFTF